MRETTQSAEGSGGTRLSVTIYSAAAPPTGGSRAVLLLHGWPNAGRVWGDFADALLLADPDLRLFAPDLRGYGDSDKPATGYDCATFAADAVALAQSLFGDATPWSLVGHSMGGKIAQIVAMGQPTGLKSLVLLAPTPLKTEPFPDETKARLVAAHGSADGVREVIGGLTAHSLPAATLDLLVEDGLRAAPAAWDGWVQTMRDEDASSAATIAVPTLVIAGGKDPRTPPAMAQNVAAAIKGARFEMLPGSGHLPHLEESNALAALVVNFLDGSLPPTASV